MFTIIIPAPPSERIHRKSARYDLVGGDTASSKLGIQAPLRLRENRLIRKAVITHEAIVNSSREPIATFERPRMSINSLGLQFNSRLSAEIRPNLILPPTSLIHLNALGRAECAQPPPARGIPDSEDSRTGQDGEVTI